MLLSVIGKKVGMTQIFDENRVVVPVTVVNIANTFVTQIKTEANDGYTAVQVGMLRKRYRGLPYKPEWIKNRKKYFLHVREARLADAADAEKLKVGQNVTRELSVLEEGGLVAVSGRSKGKGFQGVVKRWNFAGGPKTHGSTFHRTPGSMGGQASQGKVMKGKKLPGHDGFRMTTVKGLKIIKADDEMQCLFIKGAVPGKKDSLIEISKKG